MTRKYLQKTRAYLNFCNIIVILFDFVNGQEDINEMNNKISNDKSGNAVEIRFLQNDTVSRFFNDIDIKKNATHVDFGLTIKKRSGIILGVCGLSFFIIVIALCCYIRSLRKKRR